MLIYIGNQLTSLDVIQNPILFDLTCGDNQLICLNMANGNDINLIMSSAQVNPNLNCIEVDDAEWFNTNWPSWFCNLQMEVSEDCNNDCSNTSILNELTNPQEPHPNT